MNENLVILNEPDNMAVGVPGGGAGDDGKAALRGFGYTTSGRAFGHGGAGGQIAWADPETGLSFAYLTNGLDAFVPNQWRRIAGLSSRAAVCVA